MRHNILYLTDYITCKFRISRITKFRLLKFKKHFGYRSYNDCINHLLNIAGVDWSFQEITEFYGRPYKKD